MSAPPAELTIKSDWEGIDWRAVRELYRITRFDNGRSAGVLRKAFRGSYCVRFALDGPRLVGTARAISDGVCCATVFDVCVHPDYQRRGVGSRLVRDVLAALPTHYVLLVTTVPEFYERLGFQEETRAMVRY